MIQRRKFIKNINRDLYFLVRVLVFMGIIIVQ
jgi:hypothetical protein